MSNRPDSLETLQLTLELLKRIRKDRAVTASELRQKLIDTDTKYTRELRTIQRLLETLSDPDFRALDIERDESSKPYRYRWKESAKGITTGALSPQESLLLTLAEQQLGNLLPARLMKSMEGFFSQARGRLDDSESTQLEREWLSKVRVVSTSQPLLPPKIDADVFAQVSNALYGNQWLDVQYKSVNGKNATKYKVMPLGLVQQGPRMYLACRFDGYDDNRSLALHRMFSAKASNLQFDRPKDFDLSLVNEDLSFSDGPQKMVRLSFKIDTANGLHMVDCPLSKDQQVVELEDGYEITATVADTDVLDRWLAGFGDAVQEFSKLTAK